MDSDSWTRLFKWMKGRVNTLDCQHGRIDTSELNCESFLSGKLSYVADIKTSNEMILSLSIIEADEFSIDIEIGEIASARDLDMLLEALSEIAEVFNSKDYIICPEGRKNEAFMVNGLLV